MSSNYSIILIADTHVGDRIGQLDPQLLDAIRSESPDEIWHAGDVCEPSVIIELNKIAPTIAVEGNRDWFLRYRLPKEIAREINGIRFLLTHGHISIKEWALNYLRLFTTFRKLNHTHFQKALASLYADYNVICYGHVHEQIDEMMDGQRFINPGSGYPERRNNFRCCYALLEISSSGDLKVTRKSVPNRSV